MRPGIAPLCDKHKSPTTLSRYEGGSFGMHAFACDKSECTRAYNTSSGYFDVVNGSVVLRKEQQLCPVDGTAMFLESVRQGGAEIWRCGQINCEQAVPLKP
jgi:hypothetical protein